VIARPNTTVDVLRDADATDTDEWDDPTETDGPAVVEGMPISISEQVTRVWDGTTTPGVTSPDTRVLRYNVGRAPHGADVRVGDRLREPDGTVWSVAQTFPVRSSLLAPDLRLELVRLG
jgi:hypothetical protein